MKKFVVFLICIVLLSGCAGFKVTPEVVGTLIQLASQLTAGVDISIPDNWLEMRSRGSNDVTYVEENWLFSVRIRQQQFHVREERQGYILGTTDGFTEYCFGTVKVYPHDVNLVQGNTHIFRDEDGEMTARWYFEAKYDFEYPVIFVVIECKYDDIDQVAAKVLPFVQTFTNLEAMPAFPDVLEFTPIPTIPTSLNELSAYYFDYNESNFPHDLEYH